MHHGPAGERGPGGRRPGSDLFTSEGALRPRLPRILCALAPLAAAALTAAPARSEELPQLRWDRPVRCMVGPGNSQVRVQCEQGPGGERCLVAPGVMEGSGEPLDDVQACSTNEGHDAYRALAARGARLVPAVAEAPPGYARSAIGRAFQVKFDLLNRLYLGVGWVPTFQSRGPATAPPSFPFGRAEAEAGIHLSALSPGSRARHDLRILEGAASFDDLELRGVLLTYDYQHVHRRPAFWLSTFLGPPEVHPVAARTGWGFRLLSVSDRPPAFRDTLDVEMAEAHLAWHPWQSEDMYSHLRLEAGGDFGEYWQDRAGVREGGLDSGLWYAGVTGAVRSRFSLGEGGLHSMSTDLAYRRPTVLQGDARGATINRLDASIAYEGIFVAINDQPLSVRLAAAGSTRNDLAEDIRSVELRFSAGLRLSFWAPPRVFEPMPEYEDP